MFNGKSKNHLTNQLINVSQKLEYCGIGGHDPNSKDKDELGHVPSFLPAYSLCNSDSNSISV